MEMSMMGVVGGWGGMNDGVKVSGRRHCPGRLSEISKFWKNNINPHRILH